MADDTLIIRADASASMGTGHLMRCLALAHAWQDYAEENRRNCVFAMANPTAPLERRLRSERFEVLAVTASSGSVEDANQVVELMSQHNARWVVVDGYQFAAEYHRTLKDAGRRVLVVDDHGHTGTHFADLVLDQNPGADKSFYVRRQPYTRLLLGPRYAMLRREFRAWRKWKREIAPVARKILVTMGGSDPEGLSQRVIHALDFLHVEEFHATVVVGPNNLGVSKLRELAERFEGKVCLQCDPGNMAELMASADMAVSSAGSTCWEMCMLGLPAIVIDAAANQLPVATKLAQSRIAFHIPIEQATPACIAVRVEHLIGSMGLRGEMSKRGHELVDGYGADRVVAAMSACSMIMRPVRAEDSPILWEWANDASVRRASFSSGAIPWDEHVRWFSRKLHDPACSFLIFEDDGTPAGTARIQSATELDAEVSITISPQYRGRGLAPNFLERAAECAFSNSLLQRVHALVKPENFTSLKSFENAGFFLVGSTTVNACEALHYVREREASLHSSVMSDVDQKEMVRCR